jgi:manganese/iron transport system substrate-binding protein
MEERMNLVRLALIVTLLALTAFIVGCEEDESGEDTPSAARAGNETPGESASLKVVTTVSPITSIAENIGGDKIELEGVVPEGVNSHTFEPPPSLAATMEDADLIVVNGLALEEPTIELAEANKPDDTPILVLGDNTVSEEEWKFDFSFPESEGNPNPHLWPNPFHGLKYAELIRDQLVELDPENADYYNANYEAFEAKINEVDELTKQAVATVPEENRKLLTYHDSWAYWAPVYGFEVIGAVQPSDFSEPSAQEVADLIDQVRELDLPAVFGSEVFPSDVLEQIAEEGGAEFVDDLRDDDLPGAPGDPEHTYVGLIAQNMRIMIPALGGSAAVWDTFDPSPVFEGESNAEYPQ